MPRALRFEMADGVYHVTNRGVDRCDIVRNDQDRRTWWRGLDRVAQRYNWRIYAYCLLDNHFHLFHRTPQPNLSAGMHDFEGAYASLFNRRQHRVGPLFQGRFHAVLVERESHAWELSRYVHLNPVRAGKTLDPAAYVWSSFRYFLDPRDAPAWLDWGTILADFGGTEAAARLAYRRFVLAGVQHPPPNPLDKAVDGLILGCDEFVERALACTEDKNAEHPRGLRSRKPRSTPDEIVEATAVVFGVPSSDVRIAARHRNRARETAIMLCRELLDSPLDLIAEHFGGVSRSAITDTVRRCRQRAESVPSFGALVDAVRQRLP